MQWNEIRQDFVPNPWIKKRFKEEKPDKRAELL